MGSLLSHSQSCPLGSALSWREKWHVGLDGGLGSLVPNALVFSLGGETAKGLGFFLTEPRSVPVSSSFLLRAPAGLLTMRSVNAGTARSG